MLKDTSAGRLPRLWAAVAKFSATSLPPIASNVTRLHGRIEAAAARFDELSRRE